MAKKNWDEEPRAYRTYDPNERSQETGLGDFDESRTVQSERDDADINTIVRNFGLTGRLPENMRPPQYGDFTGISDYRTAIETVREAEASFMQMPPEVRLRFNNDPQQFLEFCESGNREEMKKLGLLVPDPEPDPVIITPEA